MKYLIDTNICIFAIKKRSAQLIQRLKMHKPGGIGVSIITVCELEFGVEKSLRREQNRISFYKFLVPFEILDFGKEAAYHCGTIRAHLQNSGKIVGAMDLLIAAHAVSQNLTLVTNNLKEFKRVPGLKLEDWSKK